MAHYSCDAIRRQLRGPVYPVLTPFSRDGSQVDHRALDRYIRFLVKAGAGTIMTTVGTSRFNLLSNDEIKNVNAVVVEAVSGNAITVVAGPMTGGLATNVELAEHAEDVGADVYIALFPERWYGDESIFAFFKTLAESVSIGIMIHEMPMRNGYGGTVQYSLSLLERLVELPGIVGMKEECMDGAYAYRLHRRLHGKCAIIGAGAMRNFMRDFHAGATANLAGVGSFFPRVEIAFQQALANNDLVRAQQIARGYEDPYFDIAVALGWHPQLKEVLHMLGLMPPHERAPLQRLNRSQRARLRSCIQGLGWLEFDPDHIPD